MKKVREITVIGAGLAGCEAAWQAAERGLSVKLVDMKPGRMSPAHRYSGFSELVCSNSLGSDSIENGKGLLKQELRQLGSLIIECADTVRIPAGDALAVDRQAFSDIVTKRIVNHKNISVEHRHVDKLPSDSPVVVATGPLTTPELSDAIEAVLGQGRLYFYDAASPIIEADSIDCRRSFRASRYNKGDADYINCPLDEKQYDIFVNGLVGAERADVREFEEIVHFEGCMPIESMAARGRDVMRFGPLKPKGLWDPATGKEPYAVVQLRQDNTQGTLYNIVGFQTRLTQGEQKRVFGLIPALAEAKYARFGMMHRNTYINSPRLLDARFSLRTGNHFYFAGQITGVEGYVESIASGLTAGMSLAAELAGEPATVFPPETMIGALGNYISTYRGKNFQPMNANFGIIECGQLPGKMSKREKYQFISENSLNTLKLVYNKR